MSNKIDYPRITEKEKYPFNSIFRVKVLNDNASIPKRAHEGDAGWDLFASELTMIPCERPAAHTGTLFITLDDLENDKDLKSSLKYHLNRKLVSTGISVAIPEGYYGRIAPRSGLSCIGLDVGAGVIDSQYRGEVKVLLINNSTMNFKIQKGDKIAQLILEKIFTKPIGVVSELDFTTRGENGFGSSGTK